MIFIFTVESANRPAVAAVSPNNTIVHTPNGSKGFVYIQAQHHAHATNMLKAQMPKDTVICSIQVIDFTEFADEPPFIYTTIPDSAQ